MLNDLIRVGDRVEFRIDRRDEYYKQEGDPVSGAQGVVVGRERITMYEERVGLVVRKQGVYQVDGPVIVQWDNGETTKPNGWLIDLADPEEKERRYAIRRSEITDDNWAEINAKYENRVFISELPVTKAWEGDFIKLTTERHGVEYGVVSTVDYHMMDQRPDMGGRYSFRICDENKNETGGTTYTSDAEFEIVERGNVYKYFNNEPVTFADLREEAAFFKSLGHAKEVRNPVSKKYSWTMTEVLHAIRDDLVDCCNMTTVPFSFGTQKLNALRFTDRELGKRLQAETLEGFKGFKEEDE